MKEEHRKLRSLANIKYWDGKRKPRLQKNGYLTICIGNKKYYVHRLVMQEKLGRPLKHNEHVHHINGDKTDNSIENLELLTAEEHEKLHSLKNNLGKIKGRIPVNKTSKGTIELIKQLRKDGFLLNEICFKTGLSYPTVQKYAKEI
jgi:hypothetical protein